MAFDRSKFMHRFIEDAKDHLAAMNQGLLTLADTPSDTTLDAVFRAAHTIKGSSRMMKLLHISDMAHGLEDVLDAVRKGLIVFSNPVSQVLFDGMDTLSHMVQALSQGEEGPGPKEMLHRLKQAAEGRLPAHGAPEEDLPPEQSQATNREKGPGTGDTRTDPLVASADPPPVTAAPPVSEMTSPAKAGATRQPDGDPGSCEPPCPRADAASDARGKTETIRVNLDRLDALINLMGEVVSTHKTVEGMARDLADISFSARNFNRVLSDAGAGTTSRNRHLPALLSDAFHDIHKAIDALNRNLKDHLGRFSPLMTQLQSRSLEMRMVPLSGFLDSLHLVVRDLCRSSGKAVDLEISGGEIEMDKKMMERLKDPLLHMVRNSLDHGVETAAERRHAGKPLQGTLSIAAAMDGGRILLTVSDDGRGIDGAAVAARARERGLVSPAELDEMDPARVLELIFEPGLSTAEIITDLSGRGVGMDVVRQNIEGDLNGTISVGSTPGQGTVFHIRLPETIAVVHLLMVTCGRCRYAVPAAHVSEIVKVPGRDILDVQGRAAVRLRGELLPVISMRAVLEGGDGGEMDFMAAEALLLLVTGQGTERLGMVVDTLEDEQERVVKPLPPHLGRLPLVSGAVISDSHNVIPVLHMMHLAAHAGKMHTAGTLGTKDAPATLTPSARQDAGTSPFHLLVVDDGFGHP